MTTKLEIDVKSLDASHRAALEDLIGFPLEAGHRLTITVSNIETVGGAPQSPSQSIEDLTKIYDGLSVDEIDAIDKIINTRANLTRDVP
jgi:hypothetical protein